MKILYSFSMRVIFIFQLCLMYNFASAVKSFPVVGEGPCPAEHENKICVYMLPDSDNNITRKQGNYLSYSYTNLSISPIFTSSGAELPQGNKHILIDLSYSPITNEKMIMSATKEIKVRIGGDLNNQFTFQNASELKTCSIEAKVNCNTNGQPMLGTEQNENCSIGYTYTASEICP